MKDEPPQLNCLGKVLLVLLSAWALIVVMPDTLRIAEPLGTLRFSANNDGLVAQSAALAYDSTEATALRRQVRILARTRVEGRNPGDVG